MPLKVMSTFNNSECLSSMKHTDGLRITNICQIWKRFVGVTVQTLNFNFVVLAYSLLLTLLQQRLTGNGQSSQTMSQDFIITSCRLNT